MVAEQRDDLRENIWKWEVQLNSTTGEISVKNLRHEKVFCIFSHAFAVEQHFVWNMELHGGGRSNQQNHI